MTLDQVRQLDATLQTRGEALSANKVVQHLGGSKRDALTLLRAYRAETPARPPTLAPPVAVLAPAMVSEDIDPVSAAPEAGPPTLLAQAEAALRQAIAEEHRIRRGVQSPGQPITWGCLEKCQTATRQAQGEVDRLHHALDSLRRDLPALQRNVVAAEGQLAQVEETARRQLLRARRQAAQAREAYTAAAQQVAAIAGPGALPEEGPA